MWVVIYSLYPPLLPIKQCRQGCFENMGLFYCLCSSLFACLSSFFGVSVMNYALGKQQVIPFIKKFGRVKECKSWLYLYLDAALIVLKPWYHHDASSDNFAKALNLVNYILLHLLALLVLATFTVLQRAWCYYIN